MPSTRDPDALLRLVVQILDRARSDQGITQYELGHLSGITQSTVSKYFRLELRLNFSQFVALCWALDLKPGRVVDEAESMLDTA
ncbi:hypothetical protein C3B59_18395 [Cryobacterium zongtaii]|uniref:HTH cro/C1-type domain-containing protein n=1 Tax=Cryobacterium zongtaii TaxID=1259217 RepID=A0A2S3Z538_9MICO|nr:helix-turn-helix transcriptional regulator [Cryobacterium zongtaii]POH58758.1 hypothetical protein C3B59_18395 [Cryobacterium zongtaii]